MDTDIGTEETLKQFYCPLEGTLLCHASSTEDLTTLGKISPSSKYSNYPDLERASSSKGPEFLNTNITSVKAENTHDLPCFDTTDILKAAQILCDIPTAPAVPVVKPPVFIVNTPLRIPSVTAAVHSTIFVVNSNCQTNNFINAVPQTILPSVFTVSQVSSLLSNINGDIRQSNIDDISQYLNIPDKTMPDADYTLKKTSKSPEPERETAPQKSDFVLFKCELCSSVFNKRKNYNRHRLIHKIKTKDDYPFKCDVCQRTFLQRCDLKRHELIHTNSQPFKCDKCDKAYIRKKDLTVHTRFHDKNKSFHCKECSMSFYQIGDLNRHIRQKHNGLSWLGCSHCTKKFAKEATLLRHMQFTHNDIIQEVVKKTWLELKEKSPNAIPSASQPNPIIIVPLTSGKAQNSTKEKPKTLMEQNITGGLSDIPASLIEKDTNRIVRTPTISTVGDINAPPLITFSDLKRSHRISPHRISPHRISPQSFTFTASGCKKNSLDSPPLITFTDSCLPQQGDCIDPTATKNSEIEGPPLIMFSGDSQET